MPYYNRFQCSLCLTHHTLADEWFRALLQRLWTHGYSFSSTSSATWEAELEAPGCTFVLGDGDTETGALATFLARATAESEYSIDISNGVSSLQMCFYEMDSSPSDASPDRADESVKRLSYIGLSTNTFDTTPPGRADCPYLHAYNAFVRTCALLCEVLDPLYGLGYHLTHVRDQAGNDALADLGTSVAPDLLAGRLPNASAWFRREPFQYIAPAYVTPERTLAWLAASGVSVQRLATGGLFVVPTVAPYTQESSIAYTHLARGREQTLLISRHRHSQLAELTPEQLAQAQREGIDALTRAITIFASINDQDGEHDARWERAQLEH